MIDARVAVRQVLHLDRQGRGGDHIPFHQLDLPAVRFTEGREHYLRQHKDVLPDGSQGDLPEFTSAAYMADVARLNVATLARLALAPPTPEGLRLRGAMTHRTSLSWQAAPGAVGYEVLWRATTAGEWQQRQMVTGTSATLDVTPDDVYWGVRAIGPEGNSGLSAVPWRR